MKLIDLLCYLREDLLEARRQNNSARCVELLTTFGVLREVSYCSKADRVIAVLVALEDSSRDSVHGEYWKSTIPSAEEIAEACGQ